MTNLTCNLADGHAQGPGYDVPPVPVMTAFGDGALCQCHSKGAWDFDRAIAEKPESLFRCVRKLGNATVVDKWDELILRFGERAFLYCHTWRVVSYAESPAEAERIVREFTAAYGTKKPPVGGSFQLIRKERYDEITCENVDLGPETVLADETFALHYPAGTDAWHGGFVEKLAARKNGLTILEGSPGTGKTSYLRHLMGQLKDTHRFYFIAPTSLKILEEPEFIGFWSSERAAYSDRKLVVILEDADDALMTRDSDNPGFDLYEGDSIETATRFVEVKSRKGPWAGLVALSSEQFRKAQEENDRFWLYVVENVADAASTRLHPIQDPAGKGRHFCFDPGWSALAIPQNDTFNP